jgi:hypothetical protein
MRQQYNLKKIKGLDNKELDNKQRLNGFIAWKRHDQTRCDKDYE